MTLKVHPSRKAVWNEYDAPYFGFDDSTPTELIGVGSELREITTCSFEILVDEHRLASIQIETIEEKFKRLAENWRKDTEFLSSIHQIATHKDYQEIIGMGKDSVLLILQEMEQSPDHWFWALRAITEVDPVTDDIRGNMSKMTEAWLNWGRINEYL